MKDKMCKKCGTRLSSYNPGPNCFAHTDGMPVKTHSPVSVCWSSREPSYRSNRCYSLDQVGVSPPTGLTESVSGVVIDGKTREIEEVLGLNK